MRTSHRLERFAGRAEQARRSHRTARSAVAIGEDFTVLGWRCQVPRCGSSRRRGAARAWYQSGARWSSASSLQALQGRARQVRATPCGRTPTTFGARRDMALVHARTVLRLRARCTARQGSGVLSAIVRVRRRIGEKTIHWIRRILRAASFLQLNIGEAHIYVGPAGRSHQPFRPLLWSGSSICVRPIPQNEQAPLAVAYGLNSAGQQLLAEGQMPRRHRTHLDRAAEHHQACTTGQA